MTTDLRCFEELKRVYRTSMMIGMMMASGIVVYGALVLYFYKPGAQPLIKPALTGPARLVFVLLSLVQLVVIPVISQIFLGAKKLPGPAYRHENLWPGYVRNLFRASIVTYAICEIPGLFGLFLFFMTKQLGDFFLFAAIYVIAFALYFPRYAQWEYELRKME